MANTIKSRILLKTDTKNGKDLFAGIIALTHSLGCKVVCEGVATQKDVHLMEEIGAYVAQGYYYSKPVPEDEFEAMLRAGYLKKG